MSSPSYTKEDFQRNVDIHDILEALTHSNALSRGLPSPSDLQNVNISNALHHVLCDGWARVDPFADPKEDAVVACYRKGWLHLDTIIPGGQCSNG